LTGTHVLPDKLRLIRQSKGCSQEELARQLQVSFPTVIDNGYDAILQIGLQQSPIARLRRN
jgi:transcriptional regulator with XRE-family HTH domain